MKKCVKCGTEFEGNYCPECGQKDGETKKCPRCETEIYSKANYCSICGYEFNKPVAPVVPSAPLQNPQQAQPQPTPYQGQQLPPQATAAPVATNAPAKEPTPVVCQGYLGFLERHYKYFRLLPVFVLILTTGLMFLFYLASFVSWEGHSICNVYNIKDEFDPDLNWLTIVLIIGACAGGLVALIGLGMFANKNVGSKTLTKYNYLISAFLVIYLGLGILATAMVIKEDEGMGMLSVGAGPILMIIFPVIFLAGVIFWLICEKKILTANPALIKEGGNIGKMDPNVVPPDILDLPSQEIIDKSFKKFLKKGKGWKLATATLLLLGAIGFSVAGSIFAVDVSKTSNVYDYLYNGYGGNLSTTSSRNYDKETIKYVTFPSLSDNAFYYYDDYVGTSENGELQIAVYRYYNVPGKGYSLLEYADYLEEHYSSYNKTCCFYFRGEYSSNTYYVYDSAFSSIATYDEYLHQVNVNGYDGTFYQYLNDSIIDSYGTSYEHTLESGFNSTHELPFLHAYVGNYEGNLCLTVGYDYDTYDAFSGETTNYEYLRFIYQGQETDESANITYFYFLLSDTTDTWCILDTTAFQSRQETSMSSYNNATMIMFICAGVFLIFSIIQFALAQFGKVKKGGNIATIVVSIIEMVIPLTLWAIIGSIISLCKWSNYPKAVKPLTRMALKEANTLHGEEYAKQMRNNLVTYIKNSDTNSYVYTLVNTNNEYVVYYRNTHGNPAPVNPNPNTGYQG